MKTTLGPTTVPSLYAIRDNDLFLGSTKRIYKIKELPSGKKPREKLIAYGPGALTLTELVTVILGVGTKKEEVLSMASRMVQEYGEKSLASQRDVTTFAEELGIPEFKAAQVVAAVEFGRRVFEKQRNGVAVIRTPQDVYEYATDMRTLPKEQLRGLYLNTHHQVIHDEVISVGTINSNIIHPREVFRPALQYSAVAVILVHNHPSGVAEPSDADIAITKQLVETGEVLGIDLLDHVIVTKTGFVSIPVDYSVS